MCLCVCVCVCVYYLVNVFYDWKNFSVIYDYANIIALSV